MMLLTPKKIVFLVLLVLRTAANAAEQAEQISPSAKLPDSTPWDLNRLNEPPAFEWVDKASAVRSLFYDGEPYGGKATRVFAYYATPGTLAGDVSKDKELPAVVLVHGGGGTAFREWAELWAKRGYAAIAMDLAGYRPIDGKNPHQLENRTRLSDGGPDQGDDEKFGSVHKPAGEQWPYHAVAAVLRAHSLVRSFPEVDANRTAVTGISWGGYLSCIVAGVDSRFKAAVPVYGCGFLHENSAWTERLAKMTPTERERWVTLWDPSRYLPAVSMPILFVNGTNDFAYPLDSYLKSYDAVPGTKQIRITVNMPHGHPQGWAPQEIGLFIDQHLRGGQGLPVVGLPQIDDGKVRLQCMDSVKLTLAALHFTTEDGAINKRSWQTHRAELVGNSVTADMPPAAATAWFLTVTDERGAIVSSRVFLQHAAARQASNTVIEKLRAGEPVRIVCFGDSVTGVYYHTGGRRAYTDMLGIALRKAYPRADLTMINAGISGHTTADALARIDRDVLVHKPALITLMFGLNDMTRVPLDQYRDNLKTIIDMCRAAGAEVLLCTPNNVISTSGRPSETLEKYCGVVREVGQSQKVPVCDCYSGLEDLRRRDALAWRLLMSDEIHPNMDGHKRMAELMARSIAGPSVSLGDVSPPSPVLARTLTLLRNDQPVKILAMPPFHDLLVPALKKIAPNAKIATISWPISDMTLRQLEQDANTRVRPLKPDLVVIAVPRTAAADSFESFVRSYSWIMNWSLSFGTQEWDCVVVHPSVADPDNVDAQRDDLVRQLVRAQDLTLIDRAGDDRSSAQEILNRWFVTQSARSP